MNSISQSNTRLLITSVQKQTERRVKKSSGSQNIHFRNNFDSAIVVAPSTSQKRTPAIAVVKTELIEPQEVEETTTFPWKNELLLNSSFGKAKIFQGSLKLDSFDDKIVSTLTHPSFFEKFSGQELSLNIKVDSKISMKFEAAENLTQVKVEIKSDNGEEPILLEADFKESNMNLSQFFQNAILRANDMMTKQSALMA